MSRWPATKAKRVLTALLRIGWSVKRQTGSHRILERADYTDYVFAFHDNVEMVPGCWQELLVVPACSLTTYSKQRLSPSAKRGSLAIWSGY